ncbi:MAG: hypothetical protein R3317_03220, partial [Burkholderiaceae bacterium]|nr:hypothetical protein [Burkholderiaceae bacterium]
RIPFKRGEDFGISKIVQFRWSDLLDFMSCTECGRCQAAALGHRDKGFQLLELVHRALGVFRSLIIHIFAG